MLLTPPSMKFNALRFGVRIGELELTSIVIVRFSQKHLEVVFPGGEVDRTWVAVGKQHMKPLRRGGEVEVKVGHAAKVEN